MNDAGGPQGISGLNLLLFSVGGIRFGIDADQVEGTAAYGGEEAEDLFWFHEELDYRDDTVVYLVPTVVAIRSEGSRPYRVIIDTMEDVAEIGSMDIRPFPPLMEPFALRNGIWGVALRDGHMVLLVDFKRLLREKGTSGGKTPEEAETERKGSPQ